VTTTLIVGAALALAALAFVLQPLFAPGPGEAARAPGPVETLPPDVDAGVEEALRAYRAAHAACPVCGPRPEADAVFCSNCGRPLGSEAAGPR